MMKSSDMFNGGKYKKQKTKKRKFNKNMRGGGAFQEVQNLLRGTSYGIGNFANVITGYPAPVNPSPLFQKINNN